MTVVLGISLLGGFLTTAGVVAATATIKKAPISPQTGNITTKKPAAKVVSKKTIKTVAAKKTTVAPLPKEKALTNDLTIRGVIDFTNAARAKNGNKPVLIENSTLDAIALERANDMFAKQYFAHISPSGVAPNELATNRGYAFISFGENIALGNFGGDAKLVDAWMHSPEHRENILRQSYSEIGVAVVHGVYEGQMTWIAVQEFGMPVSACPRVDGALKAHIDMEREQMSSLQTRIGDLRGLLLASHIQTADDAAMYNQKVAEYNDMVNQFNNQVQNIQGDIDGYNAQVQAYGACAKTAGE